MSIDLQTVKKIASLSRISVTDAEAEAMVPELNNILGWVEQLGEVDVTGVQPMTAWWLQMQMRRPHQQPQRSTPLCPRRHCHHPCHQHRRSLHRHRHQAPPTS